LQASFLTEPAIFMTISIRTRAYLVLKDRIILILENQIAGTVLQTNEKLQGNL